MKYLVAVGSDEIKVHADSSDEAIEKAIEVWHKRRGLWSKFRPSAYIIESNIK